MSILKNKLILVLATFLLQSCIGVSVVTEKEKVISYPQFEIGKARLNYSDLDFMRKMSYHKRSHSPRYSKEDIRILWGDPDKITKNDDLEYWAYKREIGFSGVVIGAVIPIPLLVPVGYRDTVLVFKDDKVQSIKKERGGHSYGFFCITIICSSKNFDIWNIEL
ncbi:MAG: hypothetical protein ACJAS6_001076 [Rickettsiales bacterium]|jgi:hypothetical protein